ncbi:hypothetical protein [Mycobacterium sp. DBP42]|uniref:hypothetical protein n=1 Tax=Mycobacterium sp. DBP42 TaxID=2545267 RepID=UPI001486B67A|nr:hypothetical protein [Mycobacterium sp. DBP42]
MTSDETPPGQDDSDWESRLRAAAESGDVLDLAEGASVDPAKAASWPPERTVPAAALRALLTADDLHVDPKGLRIRAARFEELLDLEFVHFPHPLHLSYCALEAGMDTSGAQLGELSLDHAHAEGEVRTIMATIDGQLNLSGATVDNPGGIALAIDGAKVGGVFAHGFQAQGEVRANRATIDGSLNLAGATLDNPGGKALAIDGAKVGGVFADEGFQAQGEVRALGATIDGSLNLSGATLDNPGGKALAIDGAKVGGVFAREGFQAQGEVRANGATIDGQLNLSGATLDNPGGIALAIDGAKVGGDVFADKGFQAQGEVRANGATIDGSLNLSGATLDNPGGKALVLDRAKLGGAVLAHGGFQAQGEVRANGATIDGQLNLSGATVDNPGGIALVINGAKVGGDVFAHGGFQAQGEVRALGATIDGSLNLSGATLDYPGGDALNLESATVGRLFLPGCVDGALTLVSATIGDLVTPAAELPPGPVVATGWKVGDLHGLLREDWRAVHAWLSGTPASKNSDESGPIAVQPWHALADVYDRNGNPAGARRLRLEAAKQVTRQSPWATKLLRTVYFLVARNGYYPLWAAMWLMFVLAAAVLLVAVNREDIAPTDRDTAKTAVEQHFGIDPDATDAAPAVRAQADMFLPVTAETPCEVHPGYPCMNSLTFAINAVLPPAASANRDWDIASDATLALSAGLPLLKLMSWALAALLLAGVTGLLRKN